MITNYIDNESCQHKANCRFNNNKMKTMSDTSEITFSNYGIYDLGDDLELLLPNTLIKFQRISDDAFPILEKIQKVKQLKKLFL